MLVAGLLALKISFDVLLRYPDYFPPDFRSQYLAGREDYFWGWYRWAFWTHIVSGPAALVLGVVLLNEWFRLSFTKWHRWLGRVQVVNQLVLMVPSGFAIAFYAVAGTQAVVSFLVLSVLTGGTIAMGWRSAVRRRYAEHRRWMLRNMALLFSAVMLRVSIGAASVLRFDPDWLDPVLTWGSWLLPLVLVELSFYAKRLKVFHDLAAVDRQQSLTSHCGKVFRKRLNSSVTKAGHDNPSM